MNMSNSCASLVIASGKGGLKKILVQTEVIFYTKRFLRIALGGNVTKKDKTSWVIPLIR